MKKIILFFTTIIILTFTSCDIIDINNNETDTSIYAPTITNTTEGLIIAPSIITGTLYMNIYRLVIKNNSIDSTTNIGQITPATDYSGPVQFTDYYCDSSKSYQYYIRYKTSHTYRYSEVSKTFTPTANNGEKGITAPDTVAITYNKNQCILSFDSTKIDTVPTPYDTTDTFDLMIGLNNGVSTYLFPVTEESGYYKIALRNFIPSDFFGTDLTIKCLVGRTESSVAKSTTDSTPIYTIYHFTSALDKISTKEGTKDINTFQVSSQSSSTDYSDLTDTTK